MLFERSILVENVTEIIGAKKYDDIFKEFLRLQDYSSSDLEVSLRLFLQTFRLAGVEAQTIFRVLEGFAFEFFEHDTTGIYANKEEAYEMAYLMIVLQTTMHNPNIK